MLLYSRRFTIWLVSFLAVLVIYFIYNRLSRTPMIAASDSGRSAEPAVDVCDSNGRVGMVGEVGVGVVRNVHYITLDAQKQVEREFGFEKLLHQDGNDWEIEKPYMRVYRRGFKCEIKGERARVTVETAGGRVTPRQGILTGNVTIRIMPRSGSGPGEAVMYLDDIVFVGDKSLFSTSGLVEFVSDDVRLVGIDMELIFNSDAERLEFLKIGKLRSLRIKRWSEGMLFGSTKLTTGGSGEPAKGGSADTEAGRESKGTSGPGQKYKCVLDSNVVIETPKERLLAEMVSINDIFVRGGAEDPCQIYAGAGEPGVEAAAEPNGATGGVFADDTANVVAISCDGGVVITPTRLWPVASPGRVDSTAGQKTDDKLSGSPAANQASRHSGTGRTEERADGKTEFRGERVDYSVETGEAIATGPAHIIFDVNGRTGDAAGGSFDSVRPFDSTQGRLGSPQAAQGGPATIEITAQRRMLFSPASNKSEFEGDCRFTAKQSLGDATGQYFVRAEKIEIDLTQKGGADRGVSSLDIRRVAATGGDVHLAGTKRAVRPGSPQAGEQLLSGVELKCVRMDYSAVDGDFLAMGPGLIKMDNSQTDEPQEKLGRFSLRRKCYAFLRQFDSLGFSDGSNRLVADSKEGSLLVDFFPLVENAKEDKVAITASHVEADIPQTPQGRRELKGLVATGAVTYQDKDTQVVGSEFVYDANTAIIDVRGDRSRPCNFNGAIIDAARYNVKTGRWNTRIKGPGAIK